MSLLIQPKSAAYPKMPVDSPSIVEFLCLHVIFLLRVCRAEAQWVKSQLAHVVVIQELIEIVAPRRGPADANAPSLSQTNGKHKGFPEDPSLGLDLLKVVDSRTCSSTQPCIAESSHHPCTDS